MSLFPNANGYIPSNMEYGVIPLFTEDNHYCTHVSRIYPGPHLYWIITYLAFHISRPPYSILSALSVQWRHTNIDRFRSVLAGSLSRQSHSQVESDNRRVALIVVIIGWKSLATAKVPHFDLLVHAFFVLWICTEGVPSILCSSLVSRFVNTYPSRDPCHGTISPCWLLRGDLTE